MFASKSLPEHLGRGVVGLSALLAAVSLAPGHPWLSLAVLPLGFIALRGCPTCWLVGLVQTVASRAGKAGACASGSCVGRSASRR